MGRKLELQVKPEFKPRLFDNGGGCPGGIFISVPNALPFYIGLKAQELGPGAWPAG